MDEWVIFGFGDYLSDVIDIVHAAGGRVAMVVRNMERTDAERQNLQLRLSFAGYPVPVTDLKDFRPRPGYKCCFGYISDRSRLAEELRRRGDLRFPPLVHPSACVGSNVRLGEGVLVAPGAIIGPNCEVGAFSLINRAASLGHDVVLGEHVTVGPRAAIAGLTRVGRRTTVAIGATIIDRMTVGENSFVGAGAVVVDHVPDNVVVVGVPARVLRRREPR